MLSKQFEMNSRDIHYVSFEDYGLKIGFKNSKRISLEKEVDKKAKFFTALRFFCFYIEKKVLSLGIEFLNQGVLLSR